MKLKEVPYYKSSIVLGEEVRLGQLARYDLSLLACLSHIALGCAIQHERHWCHLLIEGWIPPSAYSSHLVPLYYQPRWSLAGFIFCDCCPNVRGGKERLLLLNAPIHSHWLLLLSRAQLCLTLCEPRDYHLPGSSVHKISQTRILEWVAISSSRGSSWLSDRNCVSGVSCGGRRILTNTPPGKPSLASRNKWEEQENVSRSWERRSDDSDLVVETESEKQHRK